MAISYNEALAKLATITDEAGLRALIEQLDAAGDQSARVTALWSGTQNGTHSVGKYLNGWSMGQSKDFSSFPRRQHYGLCE